MADIFDQRGDVIGTLRHAIDKSCDLPACVKQATDAELRGEAGLPPEAFADSIGKRYPIHTKAATILSAAYFVRTADRLSSKQAEAVADRLNWASRYWDADAELAVALTVKAAEETASYYLFPDRQEGPLNHADEVIKAASWLLEWRDQLDRPERAAAAGRILIKAAAMGVDLGDDTDSLRRMHGAGLAAHSRVMGAIESRAKLCRADDDRAVMHKLAATIDGNFDLLNTDAGFAATLVDTLDAFDRDYAAVPMYGHGLARAEDAVYAITVKTAQDYGDEHVSLVTGSVYALSDVEEIASRSIADQMGAELAFDLGAPGGGLDRVKAAEILPTLPRDDARRFDRIADAHGVAPRVKAAAASGGFSAAALEILARA